MASYSSQIDAEIGARAHGGFHIHSEDSQEAPAFKRIMRPGCGADHQYRCLDAATNIIDAVESQLSQRSDAALSRPSNPAW
jgi:hypothetical protein